MSLILPGCGGTSSLARGEALGARWFHEPQPVTSQPVGLGFPHRVGWYPIWGSPVPSPVCWSYWYGGISDAGMGHCPPRVRRDLDVVPWGNSCRALAPRASAYQQPASGVGVPIPCGRYRSEGTPFSSPGCRGCRYVEGFMIWDESYPCRLRRDLGVGPRGSSRRALVP